MPDLQKMENFAKKFTTNFVKFYVKLQQKIIINFFKKAYINSNVCIEKYD